MPVIADLTHIVMMTFPKRLSRPRQPELDWSAATPGDAAKERA